MLQREAWGSVAEHKIGLGLKNCARLSRSIGKRSIFERKFDGGSRQIGLSLNKRKLSVGSTGFFEKAPLCAFSFPAATNMRVLSLDL